VAAPGVARGVGAGGRGGRGGGLGYRRLLIVVISTGLVWLVCGHVGREVVCGALGIGLARGRVGVHRGEGRGHHGGDLDLGRVGDTPHILARVVAGHGLARLQAELEISQALLVLLPGDVDPGLLAGVELRVADPAVVLQGGGEGHRAHHVPPLSWLCWVRV